jgi:hypothetical protein
LQRVLLGALVALPGCLSMSASTEFGPRISNNVLAQIQPGETTRAELLTRLGPPSEFLAPEVGTALGDDEARLAGAIRVGNRAHRVLTWQHERLRARGRWWLIYLWTEAVVDSDVLMVVLDENNVVSAVGLRRAGDE